MKKIYYKIVNRANVGTEEEPSWVETLFSKIANYSEAAEEIARAEAYEGKYEIYDDGKPDPAEQPTQLDRIEAQVAYNSIMLGTLMEV